MVSNMGNGEIGGSQDTVGGLQGVTRYGEWSKDKQPRLTQSGFRPSIWMPWIGSL